MAAGGRESSSMLEDFSPATFAGREGETFQVSADWPTPLTFRLVEVADLRRPQPSPGRAPRRREPFSIVFQGPREPVLPQQIYRMEHAALGSFDLFIVPIGAEPDGVLYEAVFG